MTKYELPETTSRGIMYFARSYRSTDLSYAKQVPLGEEVTYFEYKPRFQTRIRAYLKDFNRCTMVLLTQEQISEMEIPEEIIKDLDDIPKVYRSGSSVGSTVKTFAFDRSRTHWNSREFWDESKTEVDGSEMVYIEINRFNPTGTSVSRIWGLGSNRDLKNTIEKLEAVGISVPKIHGLKSAFLDTKGFKKGNYIPLNDWMEREVEKIAPDSVPEYNSCDQELMKALAKNIGGIDELDMWTELKENMPDSKLLELCKMCRLDIKEDSILQELHDDFIKQYPMLEFVDAYEINKSNKETIAKYINGVEK